MRLRRREHGQAMVETALTLPMMLFTMLGIVQLTTAYHARILAEYAVFKAARAGSVYRAECEFMRKAAAVALVPSIMEPGDPFIKKEGRKLRTGTKYELIFQKTASYAEGNVSLKGTPIIWIEYKLENDGKDFDKLLEQGEEPMRLRVKLAYFYEARIPFANWVMTRYWLAVQTGFAWGQSDGSDSTIMVKKAGTVTARQTVDQKLVDEVRTAALGRKEYIMPIVSTWSMRMMSDPTEKARNNSGKSWICN